MSTDQATIAVYDARAEDYSRMTEALQEHPEMKAFVAALPPGGRVLDLGCGPGFYAAWFAQQGLRVDAVDASQEMVSLAAKQPGVTAWQARFDQIDAPDTYDGIWANFSLLHASHAAFPRHLSRLRSAGRPGVVLHLGMKLGQGEGPDSLGRFYAYYSQDDLETLLTKAGFAVDARRLGKAAGLSGSIDPYILIRAHGC